MAESSTSFAHFRLSSDIAISSDDEEYLSSSSTASAGSEDEAMDNEDSLEEQSVNLNGHESPRRQMITVPLANSVSQVTNNNDADLGSEAHGVDSRPNGDIPTVNSKRGLHLLDLPMDILQEIIKEVTHTNDLTSLALTCSTLHGLAIPQMYSRFDIVWPDTASTSDHPAGVDALSYGLATLVMGESVFHQLPPQHRFGSCPSCGCNDHSGGPTAPIPDTMQRIRRGNYYAQYTRKFSVGNGPLVWVQEYSVTKETGKMLGTLVALAIARMVNLEAFIWDMPTGVVRDVWLALSSLATRPGHECRLERVWVRWHDNSENRQPPPLSASPIGQPQIQSVYVGGASLAQKYAHVEYPSLSILPPLKSLSVLDIDEVSYLEEIAVLVQRSWDRLKELRIGISSKVYQQDWLKPAKSWSPGQDFSWPKPGGVLGVLFGTTNDNIVMAPSARSGLRKSETETNDVLAPAVGHTQHEQPGSSHAAPGYSASQDSNATSMALPSDLVDASELEDPVPFNAPQHRPAPQQKDVKPLGGLASSLKSAGPTSNEACDISSHKLLSIEALELERITLSTQVMMLKLDWSKITTLTILRCDGHEKLWRALRRQFSPSPASRSTPKSGKVAGYSQEESSQYPLRLKHIHTDAVSPYLLLFIKDALRPNTLETVFLHEAPMYDSIVHIDGIYRNVIRLHRASLRKILVDSTDRSPSGVEMSGSRWRKWMFTREMIAFVTSGRMPQLQELSMTIRSKDWHFFLQRLPYVAQLRALHISHIVDPIHRDPKELAMQILDIVSIRPEIGLTYVGMQNKCYEILENKRGEKDDFDDGGSPDFFVPGSETWPASDTNDDDTEGDEDDGAIASAVDSPSEASSDDRGSYDGDESDSDIMRSRVTFRLREILFYDDKIAIFKARHGIL